MISACGGGSFGLRPASQYPSFTARPASQPSQFQSFTRASERTEPSQFPDLIESSCKVASLAGCAINVACIPCGGTSPCRGHRDRYLRIPCRRASPCRANRKRYLRIPCSGASACRGHRHRDLRIPCSRISACRGNRERYLRIPCIALLRLPCVQMWLPPHSLHALLRLPCVQTWLPLHFGHSFFLLSCGQMRPPPSALTFLAPLLPSASFFCFASAPFIICPPVREAAAPIDACSCAATSSQVGGASVAGASKVTLAITMLSESSCAPEPMATTSNGFPLTVDGEMM